MLSESKIAHTTPLGQCPLSRQSQTAPFTFREIQQAVIRQKCQRSLRPVEFFAGAFQEVVAVIKGLAISFHELADEIIGIVSFQRALSPLATALHQSVGREKLVGRDRYWGRKTQDCIVQHPARLIRRLSRRFHSPKESQYPHRFHQSMGQMIFIAADVGDAENECLETDFGIRQDSAGECLAVTIRDNRSPLHDNLVEVDEQICLARTIVI